MLPNIHAPPPAKKRKIEVEADSDEDATLARAASAASVAGAKNGGRVVVKSFMAHRVPLKGVDENKGIGGEVGMEGYYCVLWYVCPSFYLEITPRIVEIGL